MNRPNKRILLAGAMLCVLTGVARADHADRNKPVHIEADQVTLDDSKQVGIFTGDVLMTQGTLTISGEQVVVVQGASGMERGTVTGNPAGFRQKREGLNEYVEGTGSRIEYNAITGIMDIYGNARVKRGQDDVRGEHITYDPHKETFQVFGGQAQISGKEPGKEPGKAPDRVRVVINPKTASSVQPAEALPIKPDTRLIPPEKK